MDEESYHRQRLLMVEQQVAQRGITNARVLEAMRTVPRHVFVLPEYQEWAYSDGPLPIGYGQTISQPYIVALMSALLDLQGEERVLEIGTGSGYQTAILAHLAAEVYSIERKAALSRNARVRLQALGIENVHLRVGDGSLGWVEHAPYDGVLVTAAAPEVPEALKAQVRPGGKIVIPVGSRGMQYLECWQHTPQGFRRQVVAPVAFVPLIGKQGWPEERS
ncbi:MAG: protein-L-isoaspartate(D-aspartate) O-methyltransferase [Anaerolineae bacterium]|nr:MAG: protein-L-isoaspartate(D-aspartate) O-methyltransferase [Anaerolineae bacterium]